MAKKKEAAAPATSPNEDAPAAAKPTPAPSPRYKYIGPDVPRLNWPHLRLAFRPTKISDNQVTGIIEKYPELMRYFEDTQANKQDA